MKALVDLKDRDLEPKETVRQLTALLEGTKDSQVKCEALLFRAKARMMLRKYALCRQDCSDAMKHDPKDILRQHLALRVLWVEALQAQRSDTGISALTGMSLWMRSREATIDWEEAASGESFRDYCPDLRLAVTLGHSVQVTTHSNFTDEGAVLLVERPVVTSDNLSEDVLSDEEASAKLAVINGGRPVTTLAELRSLMEEKGRPMRGACGDKRGLFLFGSNISMSCKPNCVAVFVGNALVVIATDTMRNTYSEMAAAFVPSICWIEPGWPCVARARLLQRFSRHPCKCKRCTFSASTYKRFMTPEDAETERAAQHLESGQVDITSDAVDVVMNKANNSSLLWQSLIRAMRKRLRFLFLGLIFSVRQTWQCERGTWVAR
jgi:hypothetical protein